MSIIYIIISEAKLPLPPPPQEKDNKQHASFLIC